MRESTDRMLQAIRPKLEDDINSIEEELEKQGYKVLTIYPRYVEISQVQGRLGFVVTISNDKSRDLMKILGSGLRFTVDLELGLHEQLAVFVITLKNQGAKRAILYFVYYHTGAEGLIKSLGKRGFASFFRTPAGQMAGWVDMGNYQNYLYSKYQKRT
jgi:hypothetical protein